MLRSLATSVALVLAVAVTAAPAARAAGQTILGNQLVVKDPSTPDRRQLVVKASEVGSPDTIVSKAKCSPTIHSASFEEARPRRVPCHSAASLPARWPRHGWQL
jgi:hypothetical protein